MGNVVTNVYVKFNYDRSRIEKALGNFLKSDSNKNNVCTAWIQKSLAFPQLMYSIATSRKKMYTKSPISYIDTKFGSAKKLKKTTTFTQN